MTESGNHEDSGSYAAAQADAKAAAARAHALRPWYRKKRYIIGGPIIALLLISAASGSKDKNNSPDSTAATLTGATSSTSSSSGAASNPQPPTPAPTPTMKLALLAGSCTSEYGFNRCSGSVKNLTEQSLKNIEVVTEWVDANGTVQKSDEAIIKYNPVLPGQDSPWETIGTANPALTKFRVRFKELLGGTIATRDDRPGKQ